MRRSTYRSAVPDGTDLHRPPPPDGTRERILAAAFEIFAERGFDGARTRDIADRAGANLGLIKYYFDGKERLWKAAVTRAFAELQAEFAAALPSRDDADPLTWLEYVIRQFVRFVARRPAFMRLMNDEAKRDSARMRWLATLPMGCASPRESMRTNSARPSFIEPSSLAQLGDGRSEHLRLRNSSSGAG